MPTVDINDGRDGHRLLAVAVDVPDAYWSGQTVTTGRFVPQAGLAPVHQLKVFVDVTQRYPPRGRKQGTLSGRRAAASRELGTLPVPWFLRKGGERKKRPQKSPAKTTKKKAAKKRYAPGEGEERETYRKKRDKSKTPEPVPDAGPLPKGNDDTFVIQEHHARALHWDFRLERDGVLVSWAVPKGVPIDPKTNHLAVHTEDHPIEYATFEGEIPKGEYGGGKVTIWDRGTYECEKWSDREVMVVLHGSGSTAATCCSRPRGKD